MAFSAAVWTGSNSDFNVSPMTLTASPPTTAFNWLGVVLSNLEKQWIMNSFYNL